MLDKKVALSPEEALARVNELMNAPIEFYNSQKLEGELDLVQAVRQRMSDHGLKEKLQNGFDANRFVVEAQGKPAHAQQYLMNRYFSTQLMAVEQDTVLQRYSLMYEVQPDEWLQVFEKTVLPAFVDYNLPAQV